MKFLSLKNKINPLLLFSGLFVGIIISLYIIKFINVSQIKNLIPINNVSLINISLFYIIIFVSSFVSGLSGFGFSAIGAMILLFLSPKEGIALLMTLSIISQLFSFNNIWKEVKPNLIVDKSKNSILPYLIGGVIATPLGIHVLNTTNPKILTIILGIILFSYSVYNVLKPSNLKFTINNNWYKSLLVGASGGIIGGFSAFPGSAMVLWTGLQNMSKEQSRALTQPYIITMQAIGLMFFIINYQEVFNLQYLTLLVTAFPLLILGNMQGVKKFKKIDEVSFKKFTFLLFGLSGITLILKSIIF